MPNLVQDAPRSLCLMSVPQFHHTAQGRGLGPVSPGSHSRSRMLLGCCTEQREVSSLNHGCRDAAAGKSRRFTAPLGLEGLPWEKLQQGLLQPYVHGWWWDGRGQEALSSAYTEGRPFSH